MCVRGSGLHFRVGAFDVDDDAGGGGSYFRTLLPTLGFRRFSLSQVNWRFIRDYDVEP